MLRKLWKILWISTLSFIAFVIIVATLVHIFVPEEELKKASAPETVEPAEPEPPPVEYKPVDWTLTPEEQGLAVGDWIVVTWASRCVDQCITKIQRASPSVRKHRHFERILRSWDASRQHSSSL